MECRGVSMLPTFYRGTRVCLEPDSENYEVGDIVVFHRYDKYIAHRIVDYDGTNDIFVTKGDTLFFFDGPVRREEILGLVTRVKKGNTIVPVANNKAVARLSNRIGRNLHGRLSRLPRWLKFLYYFSLFIPGYLRLWLRPSPGGRRGA